MTHPRHPEPPPTLRLPAVADLDAVLIDAGGVLVNPDWDRVAVICAAHGLPVAGASLGAAEPRARWQLDRAEQIDGSNDADRLALYFTLVLAGAGAEGPLPPALWAALKAEHARDNLWSVVAPGVFAALARLRESGLRLAVVSNANGTLAALFAKAGLAGCFDLLVDSFVEGVEKPDPRIFELTLSRLGVRPARALHVGDLYHVDVAGARAAGLAAALIDSGGFYEDADCPRFASLPELVRALIR